MPRALREVCELEADDRRSPIQRAIRINDLPNQKRRARSLLSWHLKLGFFRNAEQKRFTIRKFMAFTEVCS